MFGNKFLFSETRMAVLKNIVCNVLLLLYCFDTTYLIRIFLLLNIELFCLSSLFRQSKLMTMLMLFLHNLHLHPPLNKIKIYDCTSSPKVVIVTKKLLSSLNYLTLYLLLILLLHDIKGKPRVSNEHGWSHAFRRPRPRI